MILGALAVFAAGFAIFQRPINTEIMRSLLREKSSAASTLERHGKIFRNDHRSFDCVADPLNYSASIVKAAAVSITAASAFCLAGILLSWAGGKNGPQ